MEELVAVMQEIKDLLIDINSKLDTVCTEGMICAENIFDTVSDIRDNIDTPADAICSKLDDITSAIDSLC